MTMTERMHQSALLMHTGGPLRWTCRTGAGATLRTARARQRMALWRAFTLVELLVVVAIIAVTAAFVLPRLTDDAALRVRGAASILISDIEYAQVLTISHPDNPVVVRFDAPASRYWLAYAATPDTPIMRDGTHIPYDVTFGAGRAAPVGDVGISLQDLPGDTLAFDTTGGLVDFSTTPRITLTAGERAVTLVIAPMTGSISEEN